MIRVVVTGAHGAVGRRVITRLAQRPEVAVVAIDKDAPAAPYTSVTTKQVDLADADLAALFSGADAVVHLASTVTAGTLNPAEAELEAALLHRVLDALSAVDVPHLVVMSSAMVYGAWKDNPVPITEDAPVRPNPDFDWAVQRHRLERLAQQWALAPGRSVTVLRPAVTVSEDRLGQLANTLRAARSGVAADGDPPVQYLHTDDLAEAVVTAVDVRYDGILNVAPDGWIPPDTLADLEGPRPRLRVPSHLARVLSALRWRWGLAPTPPGVVPYTTDPWVVANDRLRALGWRAAHSNEEAWVVSHEPHPLESLPARRRQELALAIAAALLASGVVAAVLIVRSLRRHRRATRA
ncbi:MAG: NAD-dependent epimerase/dehydratase family protein [Acidimicrobiaceae bacterium]|nr:NAD-dependent epimerase/dehydratase family protein [Acidimicrobiaceae bacterium]MYF42195.1 NAD-dependent epimerase/dehydratase family protein [Acidimicrobiaceae bacterium]MYJ37085.1 NAD-dependent epimerase/dehydratase family protein [Acidimicrobiaceae bacterium]